MKRLVATLLVLIPAQAFALASSSVTAGTLTVASDIVAPGTGDSIAITCSASGTVLINAADPSSGAASGASIDAVVINGGAGDDTINIASANCLGNATRTINGGGGNDTIVGSNKNDVVDGGEGNDTISGKNGKDLLNGSAGDDNISGGNGKDTINGGDGNDTISGGNGNDKIDAGADTDTINDNKGQNKCSNAEAGNCGVKKGNGGGKGKK